MEEGKEGEGEGVKNEKNGLDIEGQTSELMTSATKTERKTNLPPSPVLAHLYSP